MNGSGEEVTSFDGIIIDDIVINGSAPSNNVSTGGAGGAGSYYVYILYNVICPILFGLVTVIGTIGNCLVIYVIISRVKMRTVTNLLLLNLAFADLSFVLICVPFTAYQFATERWPFGDGLCKLMHYLLNVTAYVTVYTLVLVSLIRYLTIVYSVQTQRFRTRQNIVLMALGIWVIMLALNVPILMSYKVGRSPYTGNMDCENAGVPIARCIYATFFAFAYVLPLIVIALLSFSILHHINKNRPSTLNKKQRSRSSIKKRQATRLIIIVVVIFGICWLPVHIHLLIAYFGTIPVTPFYLTISLLWNTLAYFNSCINPIIYNYASKEFRDSFREVMCCTRQYRRDREHSMVHSRLMRTEEYTMSYNHNNHADRDKTVVFSGINKNCVNV